VPRVGGVTQVTCWLGYALGKSAQPSARLRSVSVSLPVRPQGLGGWQNDRTQSQWCRALVGSLQKESAAGADCALFEVGKSSGHSTGGLGDGK